MGNGFLPHGDISKASAHWNLHYVNNDNVLVEPRDYTEFVTYVDNYHCYGFDYGYRDEHYRFSFLFGGPGGQC
ncbi:protein of unknown function DUF239 [Macleaya cordata]|uniref:Neprosin PEP catalytic domain-containing protein n=1 Tax=Macleaya cordata TaxID=56857 RepID=A0A200PSP0_MACCD|nr:protein of unknown function DUF239 [Macleaya cordata]